MWWYAIAAKESNFPGPDAAFCINQLADYLLGAMDGFSPYKQDQVPTFPFKLLTMLFY